MGHPFVSFGFGHEHFPNSKAAWTAIAVTDAQIARNLSKIFLQFAKLIEEKNSATSENTKP